MLNFLSNLTSQKMAEKSKSSHDSKKSDPVQDESAPGVGPVEPAITPNDDYLSPSRYLNNLSKKGCEHMTLQDFIRQEWCTLSMDERMDWLISRDTRIVDRVYAQLQAYTQRKTGIVDNIERDDSQGIEADQDNVEGNHENAADDSEPGRVKNDKEEISHDTVKIVKKQSATTSILDTSSSSTTAGRKAEQISLLDYIEFSFEENSEAFTGKDSNPPPRSGYNKMTFFPSLIANTNGFFNLCVETVQDFMSSKRPKLQRNHWYTVLNRVDPHRNLVLLIEQILLHGYYGEKELALMKNKRKRRTKRKKDDDDSDDQNVSQKQFSKESVGSSGDRKKGKKGLGKNQYGSESNEYGNEYDRYQGIAPIINQYGGRVSSSQYHGSASGGKSGHQYYHKYDEGGNQYNDTYNDTSIGKAVGQYGATRRYGGKENDHGQYGPYNGQYKGKGPTYIRTSYPSTIHPSITSSNMGKDRRLDAQNYHQYTETKRQGSKINSPNLNSYLSIMNGVNSDMKNALNPAINARGLQNPLDLNGLANAMNNNGHNNGMSLNAMTSRLVNSTVNNGFNSGLNLSTVNNALNNNGNLNTDLSLNNVVNSNCSPNGLNNNGMNSVSSNSSPNTIHKNALNTASFNANLNSIIALNGLNNGLSNNGSLNNALASSSLANNDFISGVDLNGLNLSGLNAGMISGSGNASLLQNLNIVQNGTNITSDLTPNHLSLDMLNFLLAGGGKKENIRKAQNILASDPLIHHNRSSVNLLKNSHTGNENDEIKNVNDTANALQSAQKDVEELQQTIEQQRKTIQKLQQTIIEQNQMDAADAAAVDYIDTHMLPQNNSGNSWIPNESSTGGSTRVLEDKLAMDIQRSTSEEFFRREALQMKSAIDMNAKTVSGHVTYSKKKTTCDMFSNIDEAQEGHSDGNTPTNNASDANNSTIDNARDGQIGATASEPIFEGHQSTTKQGQQSRTKVNQTEQTEQTDLNADDPDNSNANGLANRDISNDLANRDVSIYDIDDGAAGLNRGVSSNTGDAEDDKKEGIRSTGSFHTTTQSEMFSYITAGSFTVPKNFGNYFQSQKRVLDSIDYSARSSTGSRSNTQEARVSGQTVSGQTVPGQIIAGQSVSAPTIIDEAEAHFGDAPNTARDSAATLPPPRESAAEAIPMNTTSDSVLRISGFPGNTSATDSVSRHSRVENKPTSSAGQAAALTMLDGAARDSPNLPTSADNCAVTRDSDKAAKESAAALLREKPEITIGALPRSSGGTPLPRNSTGTIRNKENASGISGVGMSGLVGAGGGLMIAGGGRGMDTLAMGKGMPTLSPNSFGLLPGGPEEQDIVALQVLQLHNSLQHSLSTPGSDNPSSVKYSDPSVKAAMTNIKSLPRNTGLKELNSGTLVNSWKSSTKAAKYSSRELEKRSETRLENISWRLWFRARKELEQRKLSDASQITTGSDRRKSNDPEFPKTQTSVNSFDLNQSEGSIGQASFAGSVAGNLGGDGSLGGSTRGSIDQTIDKTSSESGVAQAKDANQNQNQGSKPGTRKPPTTPVSGASGSTATGANDTSLSTTLQKATGEASSSSSSANRNEWGSKTSSRGSKNSLTTANTSNTPGSGAAASVNNTMKSTGSRDPRIGKTGTTFKNSFCKPTTDSIYGWITSYPCLVCGGNMFGGFSDQCTCYIRTSSSTQKPLFSGCTIAVDDPETVYYMNNTPASSSKGAATEAWKGKDAVSKGIGKDAVQGKEPSTPLQTGKPPKGAGKFIAGKENVLTGLRDSSKEKGGHSSRFETNPPPGLSWNDAAVDGSDGTVGNVAAKGNRTGYEKKLTYETYDRTIAGQYDKDIGYDMGGAATYEKYLSDTYLHGESGMLSPGGGPGGPISGGPSKKYHSASSKRLHKSVFSPLLPPVGEDDFMTEHWKIASNQAKVGRDQLSQRDATRMEHHYWRRWAINQQRMNHALSNGMRTPGMVGTPGGISVGPIRTPAVIYPATPSPRGGYYQYLVDQGRMLEHQQLSEKGRMLQQSGTHHQSFHHSQAPHHHSQVSHQPFDSSAFDNVRNIVPHYPVGRSIPLEHEYHNQGGGVEYDNIHHENHAGAGRYHNHEGDSLGATSRSGFDSRPYNGPGEYKKYSY